MNDMPYFLTFDVDTRKAVFKSSGGNLLEGTITASEPGRIAFTLSRGDPPDFEWCGTRVWRVAAPTGLARKLASFVSQL
jgi:hypothetical protein